MNTLRAVHTLVRVSGKRPTSLVSAADSGGFGGNRAAPGAARLACDGDIGSEEDQVVRLRGTVIWSGGLRYGYAGEADLVASIERVLGATTGITVPTGILNFWMHTPARDRGGELARPSRVPVKGIGSHATVR